MCSLPYTLLGKADSEVLPQSIIQEHQNFCKLFVKYQTSYERKKEENKNIKDSASLDKNKDNQNHIKIWNWFENLPLDERIKVCTIKNKWLVKIIIQLYFIYYIDSECTFTPINDMNILFSNQNNYRDLGSLLYKNIHIISNYNDRKNYLGYTDDDYCRLYFNMKENDFYMFKKNDNAEQKELEKKLIDNIILIALEDDSLDTLSITVDLLKDVKYFKKVLNFFSDKECFKDWLEPFSYNNFYNFTFPKWMHNNSKLTLCKILAGIFEQQILILYEYFFYSKKFYEFNGINTILDIYNENKKLEQFYADKYSNEGKVNIDQKKENIITLDVICDIVNKIKKDIVYKKKFDNFKKMCDQLYNDYYKSQFYNGNKILSECSENVYKELIYEMRTEKGKEIYMLLNKITFMKLADVKNFRELIFIFLRKYLIDMRNKTFLNELLNGDENKSGKKKKKKRKKNKNINPLNIIANEDILNNNKEPDKENGIIKENIQLNNDNINNKNNLFENIDNINDGNNSSSSNDNYKIEEKDRIPNDTIKENEDTFITVRQIDNNEKEETNINNIEENKEENIKESKSKNKQFFLFPLKNKKRKNKNKTNNSKENSNKKENKKDQIFDENKTKKENLKEEESSFQNEKKEKENEIIRTEDKENDKKNEGDLEIKNNNSQTDSESKTENNIKDESLLKQKNKLELSEISTISIQMINESKTKNKNDINQKTISIEKQNQIEINKYYSKPESTTSFSYNPTTKVQSQLEISTQNEPIKENDDTKNPVNMTINIINNQYIYQQYPFINNFPFMQFMYYYHSPSEAFFNILSKDITCYNNYTCKNIEYLDKIRSKYLNKVENMIKIGLEKKYMIKFGHYGSYFTNLSIEGSDIDILVYYKPNNPNFIFLQDILDLLNKHEKEFDLILPILSASVPLIKLQINIINEIDSNLIQFSPYFENKDISHLKIDLTFTSDELEFKKPQQIVLYTNKFINKYNNIKPLLLVLKRYFRIMKMNKSFTGGLSSFSLFLLILSFFKNGTSNINNMLLDISSFSLGKLLYCILEKYSFFDYKNYGINVEGPEFYYLLENNILDGINNTKFNNYNYEINILDPFTKLNVAKSSFQVDEIKNTFNKALFFFKYEAWKYDTNNYNLNYNTGNENIDGYNNDDNDFTIIKKLFSIK